MTAGRRGFRFTGRPLDGEAYNLERWQAIDALEAEERERIVSVVDSLVRDARARQACKMSA